VTSYRLSLAVTEDESRALFEVYDAVFGDQPDYSTWRSEIWDRHTGRNGFRLATAYDGERLVGFGYGYTGEHGQWWTDRAATVLPPEVAEEWLGGHFELVSIGVVDIARRHGVGRALLDRLTNGLVHRRCVLMTTANADDPARHLYARAGWEVIGPGLSDDQVIMGRGPA
jgi:ribosomal protein S18 acetylase RimI-like enzyme